MKRASVLACLWLALINPLFACAYRGGGDEGGGDEGGGDHRTSAMPWRHWQPEGPPEAVVLALHGFNDYSNAFQAFADFAAGRGVAVHAYDQRGFGANRDAGLWPGVDRLVADLRAAIDRLRAIHGDTPLYVLGESMGGAVAIEAAATGAPLPIDGLILAAPAVWGGDQFNLLYRAALWLASTIAPGWKLTGRGLDILPSDNIEMLKALSADPLVIKGTRVDAIAGLVRLMDRALADLGRIDQKVLVLIGEQDQIVPAGAFAALRQRLRSEDCTLITYPKGYHMLLRDRQRQVVFEDVLAWIAGRVPPSTRAAPCSATTLKIAGRPG